MSATNVILATAMVLIIHKTYPPIYPLEPLRLTEDLVDVIVEVGAPWRAADLARLMLVSPAWLHPTRKAMYSSVSLASTRQWSLIARTLHTRPECAEFLHTLLVEEGRTDPDGAPWGSTRRDSSPPRNPSMLPFTTSLVDLPDLFSLLPNLRHLSVSGPTGVASCMAALEALPNPLSLQSLSISGSPSMNTFQRMADRNLVWTERTPTTAITHLKLSKVLLTFRLPHRTRGLPPNLTHLELIDAEIPNIVSFTTYPAGLVSLKVVTRATRHMNPFAQVRPIVQHTRSTLELLSHTMIHGPASSEAAWGTHRWRIPECPTIKTLETDGDLYAETWFPNLKEMFPALDRWTIWSRPASDEQEESEED